MVFVGLCAVLFIFFLRLSVGFVAQNASELYRFVGQVWEGNLWLTLVVLSLLRWLKSSFCSPFVSGWRRWCV